MRAYFERQTVPAILALHGCKGRTAAEPRSRGGNLIRRRVQHGRGRAPHDVRAEVSIDCGYIVQAVGSMWPVRCFYATVSVSTETPY